jgi:hypothetical protein
MSMAAKGLKGPEDCQKLLGITTYRWPGTSVRTELKLVTLTTRPVDIKQLCQRVQKQLIH